MFKLMELPYAINALAPYISGETLHYHYGRHHQGYVDQLNALIEGTPLAEKTLEALIREEKGAVFNNAAQIWNHDFYWQCLMARGKEEPGDELFKALEKTFGSFDEFKRQFKAKALSNFGSGWTWLVKNQDNKLELINTSNADNPLLINKRPLLTCDIWEHAYYVDYRNSRGAYVDGFWHIINWEFVEKNYVSASSN